MILTTINVNGVRAAVRQRSEDNLGLLDWLERTAADAVSYTHLTLPTTPYV